jgi:hypothetical protein
MGSCAGLSDSESPADESEDAGLVVSSINSPLMMKTNMIDIRKEIIFSIGIPIVSLVLTPRRESQAL